MEREDYKASKYFIEAQLDNDYSLIYSTITASLLKIENCKLLKFKNNDFTGFNDLEFDTLKKYELVTKTSQLDKLRFLREDTVKNIDNENLGLTILTTTGCNARCYYCYEQGIKTYTMNIETAEKVVSFIEKHHHNKDVHLSWFGGEPLLNIKVINYICTRLNELNIKYHSSFTSNGYLFSLASIEDFKLWHIGKVQITLDGVGDEYNRIKNYKNIDNPFKDVICNIHYLLDNKVAVSIRINYDPINYKNALEVIDYIYKEFGNENKLLSAYCFNIYLDGVKNVNDYDVNDAKNPYYIIMERLFKYGYIQNLDQLSLKMKRTYCGIYHNYYVINPNGMIFKCEHKCKDEDCIVGTLESGITEINEMQYWLDTRLRHDECKECNILPTCQGGCKSLSKEFGFEVTCSPLKKFGSKILKMYYEYVMLRKEAK